MNQHQTFLCNFISGNFYLLLLILLMPAMGMAQDEVHTKKRIDSFTATLVPYNEQFIEKNIARFRLDSGVKQKLVHMLLPDTAGLASVLSSFRKPFNAFPTKPFLHISGGYISYNWDYRSGMDSSVLWNNISQHLVIGSFNALLAQSIPVRITYLERRSNSDYFKDFRDIRADLDVQQYRQLRTQRALHSLGSYADKLRDPLVPFAYKSVLQKADQLKNIVHDPSMVRELIHARETLIRENFTDTSARFKDSVTTLAKQFISFYDTLQAKLLKYEHLGDSLHEVYRQSEKKIGKIQQLLNGKPASAADLDELAATYGKDDKRVKQLRQAYSGIRSLSLGRTLPDFSNLTLQNVNVNGINLEYSRNNVYAAAAAGVVDFRLRDFLYSQQKPAKQYVYSARLGYGSREKDHVILTYFHGKKQLFGGSFQNIASEIQGVSLAAQYYVYKGVRVYGEVAQSGVPYTTSAGGITTSKATIRLSDKSQRAYAAGFSAYIPETQTLASGYYQYTGLNYQSFNSFQYNATANSWSFGLTQPFWKRQLTLRAAFRKNDFNNPLVPQRYNANTVFKNLVLTFNKNKWPVVSVGYMPASQFTAVGTQVFENHYQAFTSTISYQYTLGTIKASSLVTFSQFLNDSQDSGFIYYNSKNFFWNQTFMFSKFTTTLNVSGMNNGQQHLLVMEEGVSAIFMQKVNAGFAIKINNLNKNITKVGFNANTRMTVKKLGELNLWMEQSYLPSVNDGLFRYESYNIGWTRYF